MVTGRDIRQLSAGQTVVWLVRIVGVHVGAEEPIVHACRMFVDENPGLTRARRDEIRALNKIVHLFRVAEPCDQTFVAAYPRAHGIATNARHGLPFVWPCSWCDR